ncbi:MAG TPA: hypothetical protein VEI97_00005, partial [bacterium]|nr:hypothetical protein [bacterium]
MQRGRGSRLGQRVNNFEVNGRADLSEPEVVNDQIHSLVGVQNQTLAKANCDGLEISFGTEILELKSELIMPTKLVPALRT